MFLINSRRSLFFYALLVKALLIPKLQSQFAEFLQLYFSITLVYSTNPLVSDLIRSAEKKIYKVKNLYTLNNTLGATKIFLAYEHVVRTLTHLAPLRTKLSLLSIHGVKFSSQLIKHTVLTYLLENVFII